MSIEIYKNGLKLSYEHFLFPAGEIGIRLNHDDYKFFSLNHPITLFARLTSSEEIFKLALIKDALENQMMKYSDKYEICPINLFCPYVSYGRQDRICNAGESFSLKVFANYINHLKFNKVTVVDPHSLVSESVFNNLKVISQFDVINKNLEFTNRGKECILISPDSGASKKTAEIAKYFQHDSYVRCDKLRNLQTGKIIETIVYHDDFGGKDVCIIDDLCEKGGTFIALAKILKEKNAGKIVLFVTHGLFSGNIKDIYDSGITEIFATNSYRDGLAWAGLNVMCLEERFKELL